MNDDDLRGKLIAYLKLNQTKILIIIIIILIK